MKNYVTTFGIALSLALPYAAPQGLPWLLLGLTIVWTATSSVLRAPPLLDGDGLPGRLPVDDGGAARDDPAGADRGAGARADRRQRGRAAADSPPAAGTGHHPPAPLAGRLASSSTTAVPPWTSWLPCRATTRAAATSGRPSIGSRSFP